MVVFTDLIATVGPVFVWKKLLYRLLLCDLHQDIFPIVLVVNSILLFLKLFTLESSCCLVVLVYSTKSHVSLPGGLHFAKLTIELQAGF